MFLIFGGELTSALVAQDTDRFIQALLIFLSVLLVGIPFASIADYLKAKLGLSWRNWLTHRYLHKYLEQSRFYQIRLLNKVDNPDQRIETDIRTLTRESLEFLAIGLESMFQLFGIAGVLWRISLPLMIFVVIYSIAGTIISTVFFGRTLIGINQAQLQREADFRYGLARIEKNAEKIALYDGGITELKQSQNQFQNVYSNFKHLIRWQFGLNLFQNHYQYATFIIPGVILAPRLFAGELEIGDITQAGTAFKLMLGALALIVLKMQQLTNLGAAYQRLGQLEISLNDDSVGEPHIQIQHGESIVLDHVTVLTPDYKTTLIPNLSLTVNDQNSLLIVGASGVGKSSLLRAIAGLWTSGEGTVTRPKVANLMFLPQQPYLIKGSLREQLLYPRLLQQTTPIPESALEKVLEQVNLLNLLERWGHLDGGQAEMLTLSLGEQQRLAFARLLLHSPRFALLDEATSALDLHNEERLYELLQTKQTTYISIGHRLSLKKYHRQMLKISTPQEWNLVEIQ